MITFLENLPIDQNKHLVGFKSRSYVTVTAESEQGKMRRIRGKTLSLKLRGKGVGIGVCLGPCLPS